MRNPSKLQHRGGVQLHGRCFNQARAKGGDESGSTLVVICPDGRRCEAKRRGKKRGGLLVLRSWPDSQTRQLSSSTIYHSRSGRRQRCDADAVLETTPFGLWEAEGAVKGPLRARRGRGLRQASGERAIGLRRRGRWGSEEPEHDVEGSLALQVRPPLCCEAPPLRGLRRRPDERLRIR